MKTGFPYPTKFQNVNIFCANRGKLPGAIVAEVVDLGGGRLAKRVPNEALPAPSEVSDLGYNIAGARLAPPVASLSSSAS